MTELHTAMSQLDLVSRATIAALAEDFGGEPTDAIAERVPAELRQRYPAAIIANAIDTYVARHPEVAARSSQQRQQRRAARAATAAQLRSEAADARLAGNTWRAEELEESALLTDPPIHIQPAINDERPTAATALSWLRPPTILLGTITATLGAEALEAMQWRFAACAAGAAVLTAVAASSNLRVPRRPSHHRSVIGALARAPITAALVATNVAVFTVSMVQAHSTMPSRMIGSPVFQNLAQSPGGAPTQLVTSGFVHAGLLHLVLNMFALATLGTAAEAAIGPVRYSAIYGASLLGGAVCAQHTLGASQFASGASPAIAGVLAAIVVIVIRRRDRLSPVLRVAITCLLSGLFMPHVVLLSHIAGFLAGAAAAALLCRPATPSHDSTAATAPVRKLRHGTYQLGGKQ